MSARSRARSCGFSSRLPVRTIALLPGHPGFSAPNAGLHLGVLGFEGDRQRADRRVVMAWAATLSGLRIDFVHNSNPRGSRNVGMANMAQAVGPAVEPGR
jgi:hypothetical protein